MKNTLYVFIRAGKDLYLQVGSYMYGEQISKLIGKEVPVNGLQIVNLKQFQDGLTTAVARRDEITEELEAISAPNIDEDKASYELQEALSIHYSYLNELQNEFDNLEEAEEEIYRLMQLMNELRETRFAPGVDATAPFLVLGWDIKSPKDSDIVKI